MFCGIDEYVEDLLAGDQTQSTRRRKWLRGWMNWRRNRNGNWRRRTPSDARMRLVIDAAIQNGIGRFFAAKFRAGVRFAVYARTADPAAHAGALREYKAARAAWQGILGRAKGVYRADLSFGYAPYLRGHWSDRMAAIDQDIAAEGGVSIKRAGSTRADRCCAPRAGRAAYGGDHFPSWRAGDH